MKFLTKWPGKIAWKIRIVRALLLTLVVVRARRVSTSIYKYLSDISVSAAYHECKSNDYRWKLTMRYKRHTGLFRRNANVGFWVAVENKEKYCGRISRVNIFVGFRYSQHRSFLALFCGFRCGAHLQIRICLPHNILVQSRVFAFLFWFYSHSRRKFSATCAIVYYLIFLTWIQREMREITNIHVIWFLTVPVNPKRDRMFEG